MNPNKRKVMFSSGPDYHLTFEVQLAKFHFSLEILLYSYTEDTI